MKCMQHPMQHRDIPQLALEFCGVLQRAPVHDVPTYSARGACLNSDEDIDRKKDEHNALDCIANLLTLADNVAFHLPAMELTHCLIGKYTILCLIHFTPAQNPTAAAGR